MIVITVKATIFTFVINIVTIAVYVLYTAQKFLFLKTARYFYANKHKFFLTSLYTNATS